MARTPDLAGAVEAIVARTLKAALGPRLRRVDSQLRKVERRLRKLAARGFGAGRRRTRRTGVRGRGRRGGWRRRRSK